MKTAKLKLYEEEQEKEKFMVERLRTMGIQNGRATSVPLAYNVSRTYFKYIIDDYELSNYKYSNFLSYLCTFGI